jgi:hypothetical protein
MCAPSVSAAPSPTDSIQDGRPGGADRLHIVLLGFGVLALITGLCGSLWRLGWMPPHGASLAAVHGPLMISGVFGTLIGLERAVTLGHRWAYAAPALAGTGSFALVLGAPMEVGASAYAAAAAALAGGSLMITARQPDVFTGIPLFGAMAWLAGNVLWLMGQSAPEVAGWWLTFLILTIAGERMELSRSLPQRRGSEALLLFAVGLFLAGAQNALPTENGAILFGLALAITATWLLRHDIAYLNMRGTGQDRYMAICMLAGYAWLAVAGLVLIAFPSGGAFGYDVTLHAVLIGFVISTAFGHAPLTLPAVARIQVSYVPVLYGPLLLLHGSVALRVGGGLIGWDAGRKGSGVLTLFALASFAATLAFTAMRSRRSGVGAIDPGRDAEGDGGCPHRRLREGQPRRNPDRESVSGPEVCI